jgi:hydroxymethylpyrimidine pyrophosphatase-like HAD family hydrolase
MRFKGLALDLDGTFLSRGDQVSAANLAAVRAAQEAGMTVLVATARWHAMAERVAREIQTNAPLIACSGAQVRTVAGADVMDVRLPRAFAEALYAICNAERCVATIPVDHHALFKLDGEPDLAQMPPGMVHVRQLSLNDGLPRIGLIQGTGACDIIERDLGPRWSAEVNFAESISPNGKRVLTLTARGADKGRALLVACEHAGLDPRTIVAFGDAENDVEMFRVAGASFAMGQAKDFVKDAATAVTLGNEEDGVAAGIGRILAGEFG